VWKSEKKKKEGQRVNSKFIWNEKNE